LPLASMRNISLTLHVHKHAQDERLGISFEPPPCEEVLVRAVAPEGVAQKTGIVVGDTIISIDGERCTDALLVAKRLRESSHCKMVLCLERHLADSIKQQTADEDEAATSLSYSDDDDVEDQEEGEEDWGAEWQEYLGWMIDCVETREAELVSCQERTADALAERMKMTAEPPPPSEEEMQDPERLQAYMEAMAAFAQRQQESLSSLEMEAEDNREATAALALLSARRQELELLHDRAYCLTQTDADRISDIWRELSYEGEEGSDNPDGEAQELESGIGASDGLSTDPALCNKQAEPLYDFTQSTLNGAQSVLSRVRSGKAEMLVAQRLARARSGSAGSVLGSPVKRGPACMGLMAGWGDDEVGCSIHPL